MRAPALAVKSRCEGAIPIRNGSAQSAFPKTPKHDVFVPSWPTLAAHQIGNAPVPVWVVEYASLEAERPGVRSESARYL